jgi:hypothetical protein
LCTKQYLCEFFNPFSCFVNQKLCSCWWIWLGTLDLTLYNNFSTPLSFLDVKPYVLLFVIFLGLPREPKWCHLRDLHHLRDLFVIFLGLSSSQVWILLVSFPVLGQSILNKNWLQMDLLLVDSGIGVPQISRSLRKTPES